MDITHLATHYPEILRKIAQHARAARGPYAVAALAHAFGAENDMGRHLRRHSGNLRGITGMRYGVCRHAFQADDRGYIIISADISIRKNRDGTHYAYRMQCGDTDPCIYRTDSRLGRLMHRRNFTSTSTIHSVYSDWVTGSVTLSTILRIMHSRRRDLDGLPLP